MMMHSPDFDSIMRWPGGESFEYLEPDHLRAQLTPRRVKTPGTPKPKRRAAKLARRRNRRGKNG